MIYLKYFESSSDVTLREKLESIVNMAKYLWSIDAGDSLGGFYGKCNVLFLYCSEIQSGWSREVVSPHMSLILIV